MRSGPMTELCREATKLCFLGKYHEAELMLGIGLREHYPNMGKGDLTGMSPLALDLRMAEQYLCAARVSASPRIYIEPDLGKARDYINKAFDRLLDSDELRAFRMAKTLCRLCMKDRPCEEAGCNAYPWSDQTGADQKQRKAMVAEADARSGR